MVFFTGAYQYIPIPEEYKKLAYYVALACSLPFMFLWSKDIKLDSVVGELSYPIYIVHVLVIGVLGRQFTMHGQSTETAWYGGGVIVMTILASYLLLKVVVEPMDRIRQRRAQRQ